MTTPANALAISERAALADLMTELGPDAPTLCGTWTTRDLAAHLIVRATRPDAAAGIVIAPLAGYTEKVMAAVATRDWPSIVAEVRQGPPRWSPVSIVAVDAATNTVEYFVHLEDVRRATEPWEPRELPAADVVTLWSQAQRAGGFLLRRSPVGVVYAPEDGPAAGTRHVARKGDRAVVLTGPVGEIVLATYGRVTQGLEITGEATDVEAFRAFPR
jgi:uncharacterized protein (TIGR03085 family)